MELAHVRRLLYRDINVPVENYPLHDSPEQHELLTMLKIYLATLVSRYYKLKFLETRDR